MAGVGQPERVSGRASRWRPATLWMRVLVSGAGVLLAFYAVPVRWTTGDRLVLALAQTALGVGLLAWAIIGQLKRRFAGHHTDLPFLATLLTLVLAVFSLGYFALESARPGEMADLTTRTDALYFTLQVLTTVGLGDIHASGQAARLLVSAQMAFDLVFVAAAGSVLAGMVREGAATARQSRPRPGPEEPNV